jgi:hypothetical protein
VFTIDHLKRLILTKQALTAISSTTTLILTTVTTTIGYNVYPDKDSSLTDRGTFETAQTTVSVYSTIRSLVSPAPTAVVTTRYGISL